MLRRVILTAHQPCYLPWLGLFHKIALADTFISFNQVQYQIKDWNNRNRIKTTSGPIWLSVPVKKKSRLERKYTEIEIDNDQGWQRKHWSSLVFAYKKAPHFARYADAIEDFYKREWQTLVKLNEAMLRRFLELLAINVRFELMNDYRFQGAKSDLVLDMCKQVNADIYIFGAQGRDYADVESFTRAGIACYFQDYQHPEYPQLHGPFVSNLSVVDLLFNCGPNSLEILMSANITRGELVQLCNT
jgi:WbqC-like protein family